jgi:hypothetical protein
MDELDRKIKHIWNQSKKSSGMKSKKCPEENTLISYIEGVLGESDKEKVEQHLPECGDCLDLVLSYHKVREGEAREPVPEAPVNLMNKAMGLVTTKDTGEGLFDIVLKFAKETIEIITNPGNLGFHSAVPVPVRGEKSSISSNLITLNRTISGVESVVDVERVDEGLVNIRAVARDSKSGEPVEGLRISLFNPDREIASYIAQQGAVRFENLRFGKYVIKFKQQGEEIGQMSLNITE